MGDQVKQATSGIQEKTQNATKASPLSGAEEKVKGATDSALSTLDHVTSWVTQKGRAILDTVFPPDKRSAFLAKLQAFMLANPKLSAFLGMNLALTGIPLGLFILFSLSVFIFALIVGIVVGLLAAVFFTLLAVGAALLVVLPTVLFTTGAACFLFLWGLGGYYILRWANKGTQGAPKQAPEGQAIGDSLNRITGGKLDGFMENARAQNVNTNSSEHSDSAPQRDTSAGQQRSSHEKSGMQASPRTQNHVGAFTSATTDTSSHDTTPATNTKTTLSMAKDGLGSAAGMGL